MPAPGDESELQRSLGRVEGKLDSLNSLMSAYNLQFMSHVADDSAHFYKVRTSISNLSKQVYIMVGGSAILTTLVFYALKFAK